MRLRIVLQISVLFLALTAQATAWANAPNLSTIRERGDWPLIEKVAEQNLKANPKDMYSLQCLIESQYQLGDYIGAEKNLIRYEAGGAPPETCNYLFALVEVKLRNLPAAKHHAEKLIQLGVTNPLVLEAIENVFFEVDRRRWAEMCVKNRHIENLSWYLSGGTVGNHNKATSELRRLVDEPSLQPANPHIFFRELFKTVPKGKLNAQETLILAYTLAQSDRRVEALELCEPYAMQYPRETLKVLETIVASKQDTSKALLPLLKRMESRGAGFAKYWLLLSHEYRESKNYDEAVKAAERYVKLDSSETALWFNYRTKLTARTFTRVRPTGQVVLDSLNQVIRAYPSAAAYLERAPLLHDLGLYDEELKDLDKIVELSPDRKDKIRYLIRQADLQYALGDLRSAGRMIERVLKLDSQNQHCLMLRERMQSEMVRAEIL